MSKWKTIFTNRSVSKPVNRKVENIIKNTKSLSIKELKEQIEFLQNLKGKSDD